VAPVLELRELLEVDGIACAFSQVVPSGGFLRLLRIALLGFLLPCFSFLYFVFDCLRLAVLGFSFSFAD